MHLLPHRPANQTIKWQKEREEEKYIITGNYVIPIIGG
jgi:hypothetical protein